MKLQKNLFIAFLSILMLSACSTKKEKESKNTSENKPTNYQEYKTVKLTTDLSILKDYEKKMLPHLIKAADVMNDLFWMQSFGNKDSFLANIKDPNLRQKAEINYGPWDRLDANKAFIEGFTDKQPGANIYPADVTKDELNTMESGAMEQYSMVRRDKEGKLYTIPFHEFFRSELMVAAKYLGAAAQICEDQELKAYLELRIKALLNDDYNESDIAWLGMKNNRLDIVIGPIENYEDKIFNARNAYEAYVLVKDMEWSKRLEKYVSYLPELQANLPVESKYKVELQGSSSQLNAYDVIYYAGDCNAGGKTIAVNLPNAESIQTEYGTRRSQLKNAMKAKFDYILLPISEHLIADNQRKHITFDAFFANTMFHEVAHGLGVKKTLNGESVKSVLQETHSALEEGKADILGLYMVTQLREKGVVTDGQLMDNYVTFMASIFRSIRFGSASAHGQANLIRFNYFKELGAFTRDEKTGTYRVNKEKMQEAMNSLSALILKLQGDGDKVGVEALLAEKAVQGKILSSDLESLKTFGIPLDIVFEQGIEVLGLNN